MEEEMYHVKELEEFIDSLVSTPVGIRFERAELSIVNYHRCLPVCREKVVRGR